ncbi:MAG: signal peptidase I [Gemmatimonadetes bacterium]|nr:signal peptidase I [Gemmatimonadota bacterium]
MSEQRKRTRRRIAGEGKGADEKKQEKPGWGENLKSLGAAVVFFLILRTFVLQTFFITSGSMEDSLLVGDFLVVNRATVGGRIPFTQAHVPGYSAPERGDVLVFDPPHTDEFRLVKRLVGMPGERLEMRDKVLYVDGEPLDEPYVRHGPEPDEGNPMMGWQSSHLAPEVDRATYRPTRDNWGPLVIPEDHYFMLGDNREMSLDSRYWGLLEGWRVEGKVSLIYFSYNRESYRPFAFIREIRWDRIFDGVD